MCTVRHVFMTVFLRSLRHKMGGGGRKSAFISAMGNFSIQYYLSSASVALPIMSDIEFPEPTWVPYTLRGLVFAGAVVGMCVMGYLGDLVGRKQALIFTMALTILGSLGCALFPWTY